MTWPCSMGQSGSIALPRRQSRLALSSGRPAVMPCQVAKPVVNAIPAVVAALPGRVTGADLPSVTATSINAGLRNPVDA